MYLKAFIICLICICCLPCLVSGQATPQPCLPCLFEVAGNVYDDATGDGIAGAVLSCNGAAATTDATGYYELYIPTCHGAENVIIYLEIPALPILDYPAYLTCSEVNSMDFSIDMSQETPRLCGDANSDGQVNIVDALVIARDSVGLIRLPGFDVAMADVNADRKINIIDALMVAQYYVGLLNQLQCSPVTGSISLEDVVINPENYIGDNFEITLRITRLEPVTISDWYGNTEDGYAVYVLDEYDYETSFYITQADYSIFENLVGESPDFRLTGIDGPYMESHISGAPYRISVKTYPDYFGMWIVYIELIYA